MFSFEGQLPQSNWYFFPQIDWVHISSIFFFYYTLVLGNKFQGTLYSFIIDFIISFSLIWANSLGGGLLSSEKNRMGNGVVVPFLFQDFWFCFAFCECGVGWGMSSMSFLNGQHHAHFSCIVFGHSVLCNKILSCFELSQETSGG